MKNCWQEVDEKEANNGSVDIDDVGNADFEQPDQEANSNCDCEIDHLDYLYLSTMRLLDSDYSKKPLSDLVSQYLLIIMNSGKTE